jgi:hypothetical protein
VCARLPQRHHQAIQALRPADSSAVPHDPSPIRGLVRQREAPQWRRRCTVLQSKPPLLARLMVWVRGSTAARTRREGAETLEAFSTLQHGSALSIVQMGAGSHAIAELRLRAATRCVIRAELICTCSVTYEHASLQLGIIDSCTGSRLFKSIYP